MRKVGRIGWMVVLAVALATLPAAAVEPNTVSLGLLGGVGGSLDASRPSPGFSQRSTELALGLLTEPRTWLQLRLGRLAFAHGDQLADLTTPQLEYLTLSGEYRFYQGWYDSGIFLGLGGYRLRGDSAGRQQSETAAGLTLGVTAEFEINRYLGITSELAGHYAALHASQLFATAQAGLVVKF